MNLSAKKSPIHHHLTRPTLRKATLRNPSIAEGSKSPKVESGFGPLQIGTDVLPVAAAYKPIFRF